MPILIIGMGIWFLSTLFYGGYLGFPAIELNMIQTILLIIGYFILWIITIILAFAGKNIACMMLFLYCTWITGMMQYPVLVWATGEVGLELAKILFFIASLIGIFATTGALIIGLSLEGKLGRRYYIGIVIFGFMIIIMEFILILIFGWNDVIFWTSLLVLAWIFATIIWDGSKLPEEIDKGYWMLAVLNIFLDLVIVIIRIFIILVKIYSKNHKS